MLNGSEACKYIAGMHDLYNKCFSFSYFFLLWKIVIIAFTSVWSCKVKIWRWKFLIKMLLLGYYGLECFVYSMYSKLKASLQTGLMLSCSCLKHCTGEKVTHIVIFWVTHTCKISLGTLLTVSFSVSLSLLPGVRIWACGSLSSRVTFNRCLSSEC